ncbi:CBO0543 family protein [Cytobacillus massiliigabonensis]|uniref:CBO0543 family protein n=1 Tax=Cytobacillus massiliigabonensis TaxID=1871011 RepID=UPI001F337887|nr:CBO0543 family protein [Cytobacillus massiliigabonensis]
MTIAKHLKGSNLRLSRKKPFLFAMNNWMNFLPVVLFSSLYGTYLDLYFIGRGLYSFPERPLPEIFTIHLVFTLIGLPLLTVFFIIVCSRLNKWKIAIFILALSLIMAVFEKQAEALGLFVHHHSWKHWFSFIGYVIYLTMILSFYKFITYIKK